VDCNTCQCRVDRDGAPAAQPGCCPTQLADFAFYRFKTPARLCACRCVVGSAPHRPDRRAGLRSRSSRELRVIRLRSAFSACSARVSNCFRCCSKRAFVTGLFAAAAFIAHLCANCRKWSDRTLMSCPISGKQCGMDRNQEYCRSVCK
jgi:hypothetical protein